jgi:ribosomal protein S18 acetylase RimI-like enzyme
MTLTDTGRLQLLGQWSADAVTPHDHAAIADFLATTDGLGGRKFAADSRDVAEQLDGVLPKGANVIRDRSGLVRGYSALHQPHGVEPEVSAALVLDPATPAEIVAHVVDAAVARFGEEAAGIPGAYLRVFLGADRHIVIDALIGHGARLEGEFIRTRKSLLGEDRRELDAATIDGITVLPWSQVLSQGLVEQVRQLQYDTFLEHFGNMSKSPETWHHHVHSRLFTPDFSVAAVDGTGDVVGYVLGSTYTSGTAGSEERSAHTDYIGVRRDQRKRGIAELLLGKIWLAALRRGLVAASLGTDINNRSNAHLLYRRIGYVTVEKQAAYRIDSAGGAS